VLLAAAVLAAGGCGGGDQGPRKVVTTRVQVVEGLGRRGDFDAEALYRRLSPGVVTVISVFNSGAAALLGGGEGGQGSGFVVNGDGEIVTNAHVVTNGRGARTQQAKQVYVQFGDGNRASARIVGVDPNADVALLKVDPRGLSLTLLRLGSSRNLRVGEPVAAIGSPFGEEQSLSVGVISALDRNIESLTAFEIGNAIQTDAAINPGNSGGPLLDAGGQVIGVNAQIKSQSGGGEGVGFAVPVDAVRRSVHELRAHGHVDYGFLGVKTEPLYAQLAARLGISARSGALIVEVDKDSPADHAGLSAGGDKIDFQGQQSIPKGGDAIVAVDGRPVSARNDLPDLIGEKRAGQRVSLQVVRGHERRTVQVTLAKRPLGRG
jgi:S1-C subfamily serine protease